MQIRPYQFSFSSFGREIDSIFAEMEARTAALMNQSGEVNLPAAVKSGKFCMFGSDFHVDLCENENEIVVVTDLPGVEKEDVTVRLMNSETLLIKTEQHAEIEASSGAGTYHLRERKMGNMQRTIHLPAEVLADGAKAGFKNGVMEITLQKKQAEEGVAIDIA